MLRGLIVVLVVIAWIAALLAPVLTAMHTAGGRESEEGPRNRLRTWTRL